MKTSRFILSLMSLGILCFGGACEYHNIPEQEIRVRAVAKDDNSDNSTQSAGNNHLFVPTGDGDSGQGSGTPTGGNGGDQGSGTPLGGSSGGNPAGGNDGNGQGSGTPTGGNGEGNGGGTPAGGAGGNGTGISFFPLQPQKIEEPVVGINQFDFTPPTFEKYEIHDDNNLITFFFSEPVKAEKEAFEIKNGDTSMEFTQNSLGKKIIVAMKQEMSPGQTYSIKFDPSKVSDLSGNAVNADALEMSFTVLNISMRQGFESKQSEQQFEINQGNPDELITSINAQKIVNGKPDGTVIQGSFYNIGGGLFRFTPATEFGVGDYQVTVTSKVPYATNPNQTRNFSFLVSPRYSLSQYSSYTQGIACLIEGAFGCQVPGNIDGLPITEVTCNDGEVLTGLKIRSGAVVDQLTGIYCRPINHLQIEKETFKYMLVGGGGGGESILKAAENQLVSRIVGNFTHVDGRPTIQWLKVGSAYLNDHGHFVNTMTETDGNYLDMVCEEGSVLVGLRATALSSYLEGYQGVCRKLIW